MDRLKKRCFEIGATVDHHKNVGCHSEKLRIHFNNHGPNNHLKTPPIILYFPSKSIKNEHGKKNLTPHIRTRKGIDFLKQIAFYLQPTRQFIFFHREE